MDALPPEESDLEDVIAEACDDQPPTPDGEDPQQTIAIDVTADEAATIDEIAAEVLDQS